MIEVNNLTSRSIDEKRIKSIILETLKKENRGTYRDISIAILSQDEIRKINRDYRKLDEPTDVLSFEGEGNFLGEIIICLSEVQKNGDNFEDELKRVLIHGTLHLLGYDHEKDQGEMLKKQEEYFSLINK
ncbi:MAG: rRNA maturation RNase YbeY [Candidatus Pacebacteria bacterium]|nr:rRNA maturation RNase YbeY [Candidatus Paceibacterota bacterium]